MQAATQDLKKLMQIQVDLASAEGYLGAAEQWQARIDALPWVDAETIKALKIA